MRLRLVVLAATLVVSCSSHAETIAGSAINLSTNKPASGHLVILQSRTGEELGRTTTDRAGAFSFDTPDRDVVVRVVHQNFEYVSVLGAGSGSATLGVYDIVDNLQEVSLIDAQRYEADDGSLYVMEVFLVRNESSPPRTLKNDGFELFLPEDATVESASVSRGKQVPVQLRPLAGKVKGQYFLKHAILPGETRFDVYYNVPYTGKRQINACFSFPVRYYMVAVPKGMRVEPEREGLFSTTRDEPQANMYYTGQLGSGAAVRFKLVGLGTIPGAKRPQKQSTTIKVPEVARAPDKSTRTPTSTVPDKKPSSNRIAIIVLVLMCSATLGGVFVLVKRHCSSEFGLKTEPDPRRQLVVKALTEELSALENSFAQQQISAAEYAEKRNALRLTIHRANLSPRPVSSTQRIRTPRSV